MSKSRAWLSLVLCALCAGRTARAGDAAAEERRAWARQCLATYLGSQSTGARMSAGAALANLDAGWAEEFLGATRSARTDRERRDLALCLASLAPRTQEEIEASLGLHAAGSPEVRALLLEYGRLREEAVADPLVGLDDRVDVQVLAVFRAIGRETLVDTLGDPRIVALKRRGSAIVRDLIAVVCALGRRSDVLDVTMAVAGDVLKVVLREQHEDLVLFHLSAGCVGLSGPATVYASERVAPILAQLVVEKGMSGQILDGLRAYPSDAAIAKASGEWLRQKALTGDRSQFWLASRVAELLANGGWSEYAGSIAELARPGLGDRVDYARIAHARAKLGDRRALLGLTEYADIGEGEVLDYLSAVTGLALRDLTPGDAVRVTREWLSAHGDELEFDTKRGWRRR